MRSASNWARRNWRCWILASCSRITSLYLATALNSSSDGESPCADGATALAKTPSSSAIKKRKTKKKNNRHVSHSNCPSTSRTTFVQATELVIKRQIRRLFNANLRVFQRFRVNDVLGNLGQFIYERLDSDSPRYHLAKRLLHTRNPVKSSARRRTIENLLFTLVKLALVSLLNTMQSPRRKAHML